MYTPVREGYCCRIFKTTQEGKTRLFPLPKCPYLDKINCRYAALRKDLVLLSSLSLRMSLVFRTHNSNTSWSRHSLANRAVLEMQFVSLQHLFSMACGIGLQFLQIHQLTVGWPPEGPCSGEIVALVHVVPWTSVSLSSRESTSSFDGSLSRSSSMIQGPRSKVKSGRADN